MNPVLGAGPLAAFRARWDGASLLDLAAAHGGQILISWPVGVGKSHALDRMVEAAVAADRYDLVLALLPTRRVLEERAWIRRPPPGVAVVNLRPRPRDRCGPLDAAWRHFERAGLAALGRADLCGRCPHRPGCFWPDQYGAGLRGARVVFATHAHLGRAPDFAAQVAARAGASRTLVLLDEAGFAAADCRRRVGRGDLDRFAAALEAAGPATPTAAAWIELVRLLRLAPTADLRGPGWWAPRYNPDWALAVQRAGWAAHGGRFRFLAGDLERFGRSSVESRERHPDGSLGYAAPPALPGDFAIFSGTTSPEFLRFRLGRDLADPFADHRFGHPETRWYNIASRLGMQAHFPRNADQVVDFFAGLVSRRLGEGRRPLLVAKKRFVAACARLLGRALAAQHPDPVRIATGDWDDAGLGDADVVPIIHYGLIGTNLFEEFDCAFCLTGFYVTPAIVDAVLQDVVGADGRVPIVVRTEGSPRRRVARVARDRDRHLDIARLAPLALDQQELAVVLQAVGRVRPYTRPREVVTFQCAANPRRPYDREFAGLAEARAFFDLPTRRQRERATTGRRVAECRRGGLTQAATAARLGLGIATVKRHWNPPAADRPPVAPPAEPSPPEAPPGGIAGPS